ncbi:MAG: universal stress protein [Candidatus Methylomirabilales bacterium]
MHILVATDGTAKSQAAVRFGATVAQRLAGTLTLVHVMLPSEEPVDADTLLRAAQAEAAKCGVDATPRAEIGDPADTIVGVRREIGADMLVVGTHGRRGLARVFLGSVAESVYKSVPFPVAVVHEFDQTAEAGPILAPTDFSKGATPAVRTAAHLARKLGLRLVLLHVLAEVLPPKGEEDTEATREASLTLHRDAETKLQAFIKTLGLAPEQVDYFLETGVDSAEIVHVAGQIRASCIVLGTRGLTGLPRVLLGSVTDQVLRESPCPVLIVPSAAAPRSGWWREMEEEVGVEK